MVEITEKEYQQFQLLKKAFQHLYAEKTGLYFICGESGEKDDMGLPYCIHVCPSYGVDARLVRMYRLV